MSERSSSVPGIAGFAGVSTLIALLMAFVRADPAPRTTVLAAPQSAAADSARRPEAPRSQPRTGTELLHEFLGREPTAERGEGAGFQLRVLVASLPDPVDSHMDWAYDSGIESLLRAAQQQSFVVNRFWLPWGPGAAARSTAPLDSTPKEPARALRPGVFLFRRAGPIAGASAGDTSARRELLLLYVVGEVPTTGVAKVALAAALAERDRLIHDLGRARDPVVAMAPAEPDTLRVVAPFFSGSATSLGLAIEAWARPSPAARATHVKVVSGAATSDNLAAAIDRPARPGPAVVFTRTTNSAGAYRAALDWAATRRGVPPERTAVLREQSTVYGQSTRVTRVERDPAPGRERAVTGRGALSIPFPMNISSLRSEYARAGPSAGAAEGGGSPTPARPLVPVTFGDSARAMENPAVASRDLTAASVELVLDDIARLLIARRVQMVLVVATDVRDKIFLATELRRRVRDVEFMFFGANVLFGRPDRARGLRGAVVASTYPLLLENQFWTRDGGDHLASAFTSEMAEGVYNAALWQLGAPDLIEYAGPAGGGGARPPVWLTVVGSGSSAPLAVRDSAGLVAPAGTLAQRRPGAIASAPARDRAPTGLERLQAFAVVVGAALTVAGLQVAGRARRSLATERALSDVRPFLDRAIPIPDADDAALPGRALHRVSLVLHGQLYRGLRAVAVLGATVPAALVLLHHLPQVPSGERAAYLKPVAIAAAVLVLAVAATVAEGVVVAARLYGPAWRLALGHAMPARRHHGRRGRRASGVAWIAEIAVRHLAALTGLGYAGAVLWYAWDVLALRDPQALLYFERLKTLDGGLSPAVPLTLIAATTFVWVTWHLYRTRALCESTAFEQDQYAERRRREGARPSGAAAASPAGAASGGGSPAGGAGAGQRPPADARGGPPATSPAYATALLVARRPATASEQLLHGGYSPEPRLERRNRSRRADSPRRSGRDRRGRPFAGAPPAAAPSAGGRSDGRTPDAGAPDGGAPSAAAATTPDVDPVPGALHGSDPDVTNVRVRLFYLLPTRWSAALLAIAMCVVSWLWGRWTLSFEALSLPGHAPDFVGSRLAEFAHFGTFDLLFRGGVTLAVCAAALGVARFVLVWLSLRRCLGVLADPALLAAFRRLPGPVAELARLTPLSPAAPAILDRAIHARWHALRKVYDGSHAAFAEARVTHAVEAAIGPATAPLAAPARAGDFEAAVPLAHRQLLLRSALGAVADAEAPARLRATAPAPNDASPLRAWREQAEECRALYVVAYVEWVFVHLRQLAGAIVITLLLTTLLLSSYPFQPQSLVRSVHFVILGVGMTSLLVVATQMNLDLTLSSINQRTASRVDFDGTFLLNLTIFGLAPVLTLLGTEVPELRNLLFSWLMPLLRVLGSG